MGAEELPSAKRLGAGRPNPRPPGVANLYCKYKTYHWNSPACFGV